MHEEKKQGHNNNDEKNKEEMNDKEINDGDLGDDGENNVGEEEKEPVIEEVEDEELSLGEGAETDEKEMKENDQYDQGELEEKFSFDKDETTLDAREGIAEKFRERVELEEDKEKYEAIQPKLRTNYWWTIILVLIVTICLGIIVYLMVTRGTTKDVIDTNQQVLAFNEKKSRYDQSLVDAVNKILAAGLSYNQGEYAEANDLAKEAERGFSTALDYLYDLQTLDLGDNYVFLDEYYRQLEEAAVAGEQMGDSLAFSSRSADRGQSEEAKSSLQDYTGYKEDFADASKKIELLVKDNSDLFVH